MSGADVAAGGKVTVLVAADAGGAFGCEGGMTFGCEGGMMAGTHTV
jgi:hypothetical protein